MALIYVKSVPGYDLALDTGRSDEFSRKMMGA